jgi:putative oxidoreductase
MATENAIAESLANTARPTRVPAWLGHPVAALVCRVALAAIFLYAGLPKVAHPQAFLASVRNYDILPNAIVPAFALILPMVEVLAGALLLLGVWIRPSGLVIGGMLVAFIVAIASALARGIDIECGCFSHGGSRVGMELILRDLAMLAMLIPVFADRRGLWSLRP